MKRRPPQEKMALRRIRYRIQTVLIRSGQSDFTKAEPLSSRALDDLLSAYRDACRFEARDE